MFSLLSGDADAAGPQTPGAEHVTNTVRFHPERGQEPSHHTSSHHTPAQII